jgi:hypothetical protein
MRKLFVASIVFVFCLMFFSSCDFGQGTRPIPPGVREADKQTNTPIEPPANVKPKPVDSAKLRQEAEELAKLSAAVPSQMDQVGQGKMPKDLSDQLKRIEKLAKHLRSEISR